MTFRRGEIAGQSISPVEQDMRLNLAHHRIHALRLPPLGVERPPAIVPQHINGVVARGQFADAGKCVFDEGFAGGLVLQGRDGVWLVGPVVETVVEAHTQNLTVNQRFPACCHATLVLVCV